MPRERSPARLWLEPDRIDKATGKVVQHGSWKIKDGKARVSTGCRAGERAEAEAALARYLIERTTKAEPKQHKTADETAIADVIRHYAENSGDIARQTELGRRLERLLLWWGDRPLSEVTGYTCKAYVKHVGYQAAARRDLDDFKAAINLYIADGLCREAVKVWQPPPSDSRTAWLTHEQVAALVWNLLTHRTEQWGRKTRYRSRRHIVPFVLMAVYTGSRSSRIWTASFERENGRPWIDLEGGIFYRVGNAEKRYDNKRADPIRLPEKLLRLLRIWQRGPLVGGVRKPRRYLAEWKGRPSNPKKALAAAMVEVFGEEHDFVLHSFRHTCASWLIQDPDQDEREIANYLSMSVETLRKVYGHLSPDAHRNVGDSLSRRRSSRRGNRYGRGDTKGLKEAAE